MADPREEDKLGKSYDAKLMKRLLTYLKPYRKHLALAMFLLLITSALSLAGPYLMKVAIDDYVGQGDKEGLLRIALLFLGVMLLELFTGWGQTYIMEWIGQSAMYDLRRKIFAHAQSLHLGYFDKNPSGRLLTRVTTDVNALNEMFASGVVDIFGNLLMLVGIVVVMFMLSHELSLVAFIILPLMFFATFLFRKRVRESYRNIRLLIARINSFTQEHLAGVNEVQYFVQQEKATKQFDGINSELRRENQKSILYYAIFFPVVELIGAISLALIVWYGGGQVVQQALTFGTLVAFIQYVERFFRPIRDLAEKYNILQAAMAAAERVFGVLDTQPAIASAPDATALQQYRGEIEFDKVQFAYNPEQYVLRDISFRIKPGEKVALVGATGAGKTSVVSLICRFYDNNSGAIRFDGIDAKELDPADIRSQLGLVLQDVFLFSGTIKENITLGNASMSDAEIVAAAENVGLMQFVNRLDERFEHTVGERGSALSVGQRQLVSFARALAHDPRVLILDEATSSVDNETETIIQQALKRMFEGRTSVIVAHRLSTIKEADKILVFHKGRIVEHGKHEELLRQRGVYWRLYQLQYQDQEVR